MALTLFSLLLGATLLVLLTACANVANLLLGTGVGAKAGNSGEDGAGRQPRPAACGSF